MGITKRLRTNPKKKLKTRLPHSRKSAVNSKLSTTFSPVEWQTDDDRTFQMAVAKLVQTNVPVMLHLSPPPTAELWSTKLYTQQHNSGSKNRNSTWGSFSGQRL